MGQVFLPHDEETCEKAKAAIHKVAANQGHTVLGWRRVPTDNRWVGGRVEGGRSWMHNANRRPAPLPGPRQHEWAGARGRQAALLAPAGSRKVQLHGPAGAASAPIPCSALPCCSTLGDSAVKTEPVVEQFFVLRAANEGERVLPLERQVHPCSRRAAPCCLGCLPRCCLSTRCTLSCPA